MRVALVHPATTRGGISGGYRVYLTNVLPRFVAHPKITGVLCAVPKLWRLSEWVKPSTKLTIVDSEAIPLLSLSPGRGLVSTVKQFAPDVIFFPVERWLEIGETPVVVMLQNMSHLVRPTWTTTPIERLRYLLLRFHARIACRRAARVVVPSHFAEEALTDRFAIKRDHITIAHYGRPAPFEREPKKPQRFPEAWKEDFFFTAGCMQRYRGIEDIIEALRLLKQHAVLARLAIAGNEPRALRWYQRRIRSAIAGARLGNSVCWLGILNPAELSWCYNHARAFLMTSRVESFGLVAMDAMANGCPSIAADNPPLPEVYGNSAHYYPPGDAASLAREMQSVLRWSSEQRHTESARSLGRAAVFSWDDNVELLVSCLAEAAAHSGTHAG